MDAALQGRRTPVTDSLAKIKEAHGPDKVEMEERAREEAFDALTSDVSSGNRAERDKHYSKMRRDFARPKDASTAIIAKDWAKACQSKSRAQQTKMFKLWFSVAGDTKRMVAKWRLSSEDSTWSTDAHSWLTRDQLVKHYNNADLADEIIVKKMSANLWKPHPEAPELESARLYFCMSEMKHGETKKRTSSKAVEGTCNIDPAADQEALDEMLKGIDNGVNAGKDADIKADEVTPPKKGKEETLPKKGNKNKKENGDMHGPPESESEKEDDPEEIFESWMSTIMKDVQQARKIHLGLKQQPTQKFQAEALVEEAKKFEGYWTKMNSMKKEPPNKWMPMIKKCHDEIGDFRKQIKVSKGALAGIDDKKKNKKKTGSKGSKKSSTSGASTRSSD
jgi:hypothetical protein